MLLWGMRTSFWAQSCRDRKQNVLQRIIGSGPNVTISGPQPFFPLGFCPHVFCDLETQCPYRGLWFNAYAVSWRISPYSCRVLPLSWYFSCACVSRSCQFYRAGYFRMERITGFHSQGPMLVPFSLWSEFPSQVPCNMEFHAHESSIV